MIGGASLSPACSIRPSDWGGEAEAGHFSHCGRSPSDGQDRICYWSFPPCASTCCMLLITTRSLVIFSLTCFPVFFNKAPVYIIMIHVQRSFSPPLTDKTLAIQFILAIVPVTSGMAAWRCALE